jgi:hypothetical protein
MIKFKYKAEADDNTYQSHTLRVVSYGVLAFGKYQFTLRHIYFTKPKIFFAF